MLTSPVNVTIATNGAALKANTPTSDHGARREPPLPPQQQAQPAEAVIEPELPSNSPLTNVNAVTATVGSRTILQELALNLATALRIARRPDENLTALFLRIIATIEAMPQAERLQVEIRAGLKQLKITLSDLAAALRKPDSPEAARLTALAEAPDAKPGRIVANAATTTYLEEGTDSGHTGETLAMRAAARQSAAGQSVFSAESRMRPADARPADAKVLQNQLKTMFEPGEPAAAAENNETAEDGRETAREWPAAKDRLSAGDIRSRPATQAAGQTAPRQPNPPATGNPAGHVTFSSASLNLDSTTVEKIRNVAQAIANLAESIRSDQERSAAARSDDRPPETMLTLKGLAEVVTAIPAKAAELLAIVVAEAAAPLPEAADENGHHASRLLQQPTDAEPRPDFVAEAREPASDAVVTSPLAEESAATAPSDDGTPVAERSRTQTEAAVADKHQAAADPDVMTPARSDAAQQVPFTYVQVQPAREELVETVEEENTGKDAEEDDDEAGDEDGEPRRPRDEYDAIHDPAEEEDPAIVINRDSSEADRAFALYQRMGGF